MLNSHRGGAKCCTQSHNLVADSLGGQGVRGRPPRRGRSGGDAYKSLWESQRFCRGAVVSTIATAVQPCRGFPGSAPFGEAPGQVEP